MEKKIIQQEKSIEKPSIKSKATESHKVSFDIDQRSKSTSQLIRQEWATNSSQLNQLKAIQDIANNTTVVQKEANNNNGLPSQLKSGVENLSGISMDDVKVHYNSSKPAQLQAHAYAQGADIHLGPGQEKHLPHEAWHVVQQKQGRVKPTKQLKGRQNINDDAGLEQEADVMGNKAVQRNNIDRCSLKLSKAPSEADHPIQRIGEKKYGIRFEAGATANDRLSIQIALASVKRRKRAAKTAIEQRLITNPGGLYENYREYHQPGTTPRRQSEIERAGKDTAMNTYPAGLSQSGVNLSLLENPLFFTNLRHRGLLLDDVSLVISRKGVPVAKLIPSTRLLVNNRKLTYAPGTKRNTYKEETLEGVKEYVVDSRNVPTKRYAYVEKSYHQFMEFLSTGHMIGRFQMVAKALGDERELGLITRTMSPDTFARMKHPDYTGGQQDEHVALLHQIGGSGLDQRGLSLTSTHRPNAVVSNRGETFRTPTGIRIKIDLSKIPRETLLVNHYAHGGTKDATTLNPSLLRHNPDERGSYSLTNSVVKNRELLLEALKANAISEITFHGHQGQRIAMGPAGPDELMHTARQHMNHGEFVKGYADHFHPGTGGGPHPAVPVSEEYQKGGEYANHYNRSYQEGVAIRTGLPAAFALLRAEIVHGQGRQQMNRHIFTQVSSKSFRPVVEADLLRKVLKTYFKEEVVSHGNPEIAPGVADINIIHQPTINQIFGIIEGLRKDEGEWYDINRLGLAHGLANKAKQEHLGPGFYQGHF